MAISSSEEAVRDGVSVSGLDTGRGVNPLVEYDAVLEPFDGVW